MEKKTFQPFITIIVLLALTSLALALTVDVGVIGRPGVRFSEDADGEMRLYLPPVLMDLRGEEIVYCQSQNCGRDWLTDELTDRSICPNCGGELYMMSIEEREALPGDTLMIKKVYGRDNPELERQPLLVSVVLSGTERDSIHRPERCLVGQNFTIINRRVVEVPIDGNENLKVSVLETSRNHRDPNGNLITRYEYYAYWFIGNGRVTHSHYNRMFWIAVDRIFSGTAHRWAYIGVSGQREMDSREYLREISELVKELHPRLLSTEG